MIHTHRKMLLANEGSLESNPFRTLWLAVILKAIEDFHRAFTVEWRRTTKRSNAHRMRVVRKLDRRYFYSEDFEKICELANVRPAFVRTCNGIF
jgi:hypothetical protein